MSANKKKSKQICRMLARKPVWGLSEVENGRPRKKQIQSFLGAACHRLGFCLSPEVIDSLVEQINLSPSELVAEVIKAEGIEPIHIESYEHFKPLMNLYQKYVADN